MTPHIGYIRIFGHLGSSCVSVITAKIKVVLSMELRRYNFLKKTSRVICLTLKCRRYSITQEVFILGKRMNHSLWHLLYCQEPRPQPYRRTWPRCTTPSCYFKRFESTAILPRTIRGRQSRNLFLKAKTPHRISYEFLGINAFQDTQPKAKIL